MESSSDDAIRGAATNSQYKQCPTSPAFSILHLPDPAISRTFSFLPLNERVAFAMQLPVWKEEQTHNVIKTIIAAVPMENLDCLDLVASGLVDSELNHILESIDAGTNLKRLKLTHCFKIKCRGLQPLENSRVIEQIDLSLVARNEDPSEGLPGGLISTEDVVPVLNSIIGADVMLRGSAHNHQCSLRQIQLPKKWTDNPVEELVQFLSVYNRIGITCMKCNGIEYSWINTVEIVTFRAGFLGSTS